MKRINLTSLFLGIIIAILLMLFINSSDVVGSLVNRYQIAFDQNNTLAIIDTQNGIVKQFYNNGVITTDFESEVKSFKKSAK